MDHQQFLEQLPADTRKSLQQKNNSSGLLHLTAHCGMLAFFAFLIALKVPGWALLLLPYGIGLVFLFNLQHECTHKTPFKHSALNEVIGFACAAVLVQPFLWFRYFHLDHHRYTNDPERDPEIKGHSKPDNWGSYLLFVSTLPYWKSKITLLWQQCFYPIDDSYVPERARHAIKTEARLLALLYLAVALYTLFISPIFLWLWLVPIALGFPFLKLYHLAEHGLCPHIDNKFLNTRTVITNTFGRFMTWNMPYHAEHHLLPSVPFHQLPRLHEQLNQHLGITSQGYRAFSKEYLSFVSGKRSGNSVAN